MCLFDGKLDPIKTKNVAFKMTMEKCGQFITFNNLLYMLF